MPRYSELTWSESIADENLCGFASFDAPMQALLQNGELTTDNPFVRVYHEELAKITHHNQKYRRAAAIKAAFARRILDSSSELDSPFDYNMQIFLAQLLNSNPLQSPDEYYAELLDGFVTANIDALRRHYQEYEATTNAIAIAEGVSRNPLDGPAFLTYLKNADPELIQTAKQAYCQNLVAPQSGFRARSNDLLYIARQIGCFNEIVFHYGFDAEFPQDPARSETHSLNPAGDFELHLRNVSGNHWEAATLPMEYRLETPSQDSMALIIPNDNKALLSLFNAEFFKEDKVKGLLRKADSELSVIAQQGEEFLERTRHINKLLDERAGEDVISRYLESIPRYTHS